MDMSITLKGLNGLPLLYLSHADRIIAVEASAAACIIVYQTETGIQKYAVSEDKASISDLLAQIQENEQ